ncbi:MAG: enolase C-terminal domain-like protein [Planctomycetota bacterium]|jgi:L-fuconate dehydratase
MPTITGITAQDARFPLAEGAGVDAVHGNPVYSYAVTRLQTDTLHEGVGGAFTLGAGNDVVCQLVETLAAALVGRDIEELMAEWGAVSRRLADHPQLRWLGPHKGAAHLALASITNACFDLWAKSRDVPLWKLLLDLTPERVVALLDLSYVEDELCGADALVMLREAQPTRDQREDVLTLGYPGYDTSVGWFDYDDQRVVDNVRDAIDRGFTAMKLKVGSKELNRDLGRVGLIRDIAGDDATVMVDANQQWAWPKAMTACRALADLSVYWIEEPTHPDDVLGHKRLAEAIAPTRIAAGEHVPNRVLFKNYMQAGGAQIIQVDAMRVAGVSEFIAVSLLAKKFGLTVIPHVGDMGQLHQHLVLFNHIALDHERAFLEVIPHLSDRFVYPVSVRAGRYQTPQEPGCSFDLR